jgi:hypothetical protein
LGNHDRRSSFASTAVTVGLCSLAAILEGYDIRAFGIAGLKLVAALGLNPAQQGWAASVAIVGLVVGVSGRQARSHYRPQTGSAPLGRDLRRLLVMNRNKRELCVWQPCLRIRQRVWHTAQELLLSLNQLRSG